MSIVCFHGPNPNAKMILGFVSLIDLINGALALRPLAVAKLFVIHQTLWEMWKSKNQLVFQQEFKWFLVVKVAVFVVE